jgi:23S rRNA (guanine2445-N2)-methyltransferase / 23S rRNA (guanine2069-N7)-methyltransferase
VKLFATTPKGLELLLVEELKSLGVLHAAEKLAGVEFEADLEHAYKACLWSRLANRILLPLTQIPAATPEELYSGVQTINWDEHFNPTQTFNINFVCSQSKITHSLYGAQKVKDAIVDQFREKYNSRPNVARDNADLSIHVYLHRDIATLSIDLSGESLHKRGYRLEQGAAPLKENLAAAILMRAGWKQIAEQEGMLFDPMCGSGTLLIEGALMAANIAPGLLHEYFGFLGWKKHDAKLWAQLLEEARSARELGLKKLPTILGFDYDPHAIKIAFANIERAGLHGKIHVEKREVAALNAPKQSCGLLVINPPYGERLGEMPELPKLYVTLGEKIKQEFRGWKAAVFTGNPELGKIMGIRSRKQYALFNGAIPCQLLLFDVQQENFIDRSPAANNERLIARAKKSLNERDQALAEMFANRIKKNLKNLKRWVEKEKISCYRVYDADLPEYAVSMDIYNDYVCVQEYPAPKSIDKDKAQTRLQHVLAVLPEALNMAPAKIFLRDKNITLDDLSQLYEVQDNNQKCLINLSSGNLEVGLPLELRQLRFLIQNQVTGKTFLDLAARSGVMSVYAALGKAATIKTIVNNDFCLAWCRENLRLNQLSADTLSKDLQLFVATERHRYDTIYHELPYSFDIRQNHAEWISAISNLLNPKGELYLVTFDPKFKLHNQLLSELEIKDLTNKLIPKDFERNSKIFQCWHIKSKESIK